MLDILPLLLSLQPALPKTTARRLHRIILAMLSMTGRISQLGLSRWSEPGGSYRTIQRFFHTEIDWLEVKWRFFKLFVYDPQAIYLLAGDETVVTKAGEHTFGIGRFFSSLFDKAVPGLAFFSIALVNVNKRQAYSLANEQVIRTDQEIEQAKKRKQQRQKGSKNKKSARKPGRPAGSKNKNKAEVVLSPELLRIQAQLKKALKLIKTRMSVSFFVLDGHFGNHLACQMVRQSGLHLISKMRCDAALYLEPTPLQHVQQPRRKYGDRLDVANLPASLRRSSHTEDGYETCVYQMRCLHKDFAQALNVVVITKTQLSSGRVGHVILFSTELFLGAEALIDYYGLRFQIEFTFRAAKQHFGLEDFMGIKQTSVTNAMSLSFFMVNLSSYLLDSFRTRFAGAGISDLKSWYRGHHYASAMLKLLPKSPDPIICDQLLEQVCRLGFIHPPPPEAPERVADLEMAA